MRLRAWLPQVLGFLLGVPIALYYAWLVNPVEYVKTAPSSLRQDFREEYLVLIAAAYAGTGDLDRAKARLSQFDETNVAEALAALAQRRIARRGSAGEARAVANLASDLGARPLLSTPTSGPTVTRRPTLEDLAGSPSPTLSPTSSPTPRPSRTPRPSPQAEATPAGGFALTLRDEVCAEAPAEPLIQVETLDASRRPAPGVEVLVIWDQGRDHFFTGLKPEMGLGYGDFEMEPGVTYTVQLPDGTAPVTGIRAPRCEPGNAEAYPGSIFLRFSQAEAR